MGAVKHETKEVMSGHIMVPIDTPSAMFQVDKTAFSVASLFDESDEKVYWRSKSSYERLQAVELMRQVIYGYNPTSIRFQRVFEVAELKAS